MRTTLATICIISAPAAHAMDVVTDIPVTHSLVAQVMGDTGTPVLLVDQGSDPHSFQLRPSQARSLSDADLVFWVGEGLTPWLERSLDSLTDGAAISLLEAEGVSLREYDEAHDDHDDHGHDDHADHDDHGDEEHAEHDDHAHDEDHADHDDHDHDHEEHAEHDHDDHAEHDHDDHAEHDDHAHDEDHADADAHGHDHDHAHGGVDPHAWLDPENAIAWLHAIEDALSAADPDNAATYAANAEAAEARIEAVAEEATATLASAEGKPVVMFHDAYGYFSAAFDVEIAGTIAVGDAAAPSAQRIRELAETMEGGTVACVFAEPQHNAALAESIAADAEVPLGTLDPSGTSLTPGPDLYSDLISGLANEIARCVGSGA